MRIIFVYPPRNRRLWVLIFLLSMWAGCELGATRADEARPIAKQWLDTRDVVDDRGYQQDRFREMLYGKRETRQRQTKEKGKPKKHSRQDVPDAEQTSPDAEIKRRQKRGVEHPASEGRAARGIPLSLRQQNPGRSHHPAYTGASNETKVYPKARAMLRRG